MVTRGLKDSISDYLLVDRRPLFDCLFVSWMGSRVDASTIINPCPVDDDAFDSE